MAVTVLTRAAVLASQSLWVKALSHSRRLLRRPLFTFVCLANMSIFKLVVLALLASCAPIGTRLPPPRKRIRLPLTHRTRNRVRTRCDTRIGVEKAPCARNAQAPFGIGGVGILAPCAGGARGLSCSPRTGRRARVAEGALFSPRSNGGVLAGVACLAARLPHLVGKHPRIAVGARSE